MKKPKHIPRALAALFSALTLCFGLLPMALAADAAVTDAAGTVTVSWEDDAGTRHTADVTVLSSSGEAISGAEISADSDGFTIILPDSVTLNSDPVPVTVRDSEGAPQADISMSVAAQDRYGAGKTDANGTITIPASAQAYIYGYPDGSFRPEGSLSREEAAAIFARLLSAKDGDPLPDEADTAFSDVPSDCWCSGAVAYLCETGVLSDGGTFHPEDAITRGEFISMANSWYACYSGTDETSAAGECLFDDVDGEDPNYNAICLAAQRGWISGYEDGGFDGDRAITRAEAVTIVNRALGRSAAGLASKEQRTSPFTDLSETHWAFADILAAAGSADMDASK